MEQWPCTGAVEAGGTSPIHHPPSVPPSVRLSLPLLHTRDNEYQLWSVLGGEEKKRFWGGGGGSKEPTG